MKPSIIPLPLTELQIARLVGGTKQMVRNYLGGKGAIPDPVLQRLHHVFRLWEQVNTDPERTAVPMMRASAESIKRTRLWLAVEMKKAERDMLQGELTLETMQKNFQKAAPLFALVEQLRAENKEDRKREHELLTQHRKLERILDAGDPLQQLLVCYRIHIARSQQQIAAAMLNDLDLLQTGLYIVAPGGGEARADEPPARLN
ncbi:hypothetical protein [Niabella sp.]|uniref:hypothetical protein n=1 Tax=Niabella sp. TaxID=1962976 RepID=UPI00262319E6|nr:hypothetical protein [Niabella sp.]